MTLGNLLFVYKWLLIFGVSQLGGTNQSVWLWSVGNYDSKTNRWGAVDPMFNAGSSFSTEVVDGLLFVVGGYKESRTTKVAPGTVPRAWASPAAVSAAVWCLKGWVPNSVQICTIGYWHRFQCEWYPTLVTSNKCETLHELSIWSRNHSYLYPFKLCFCCRNITMFIKTKSYCDIWNFMQP